MKYSILTLAYLIITILSCHSENQKRTSIEEVYLSQYGEEVLIPNESFQISVIKDDFSILFYNRKYESEAKEYYTAQIAAFLDIEELDKIKVGMKTEEISCYKSGTGIAGWKDKGYESLYFNKEGHHYLFYEDENHKRLNLIKEGEDFHRFEFEIKSLYINNTMILLRDTDLQEFYLSIFIDRNLNAIIDQNELTKLSIKLSE